MHEQEVEECSRPAPPVEPAQSGDLARETALVRDRYDRTARFYDLQTWPMELLMLERHRRRLTALVRGPRVLEVGVGTGRNLSLYRPDVHVDGIDFSPRMLARARRRPLGPNITLHQMDAQAMVFDDASFDTVVATCVFCSVPDPVLGLREVRRVLRRDGQALMLEHVRPGARWLGALFDRLDPFVSRRGPHINRRTIENIRAAGLAIEREENVFSDFVKLIVARP